MKGTAQSLPRNGFEMEVAGVTFENRQDLINPSLVGSEVFLIRHKANFYDEFAIKVFRADGECLGFVPRRYASHLAPFAEYQQLSGVVKAVLGGTPDKPAKGVRIWVWDDAGRPLPIDAMLAEGDGELRTGVRIAGEIASDLQKHASVRVVGAVLGGGRHE